MKKISLALFTLLFLSNIAGAISIEGLRAMAQQQNQKEMGQFSLHSFSVEDINKNTITLITLNSKPTIFSFWTTWSPAGAESIKVLSDFYSQNKSSVNVIGMNYENIEHEDLVDFVKRNQISTPVVPLNNKNYQQFQSFPPVDIIPTTYIFNKDGNLVDRYVGELDHATLSQYLLDSSRK